MCLHICWPRPATSGCSKHARSSSGTPGVCVSTGPPNQLQVHSKHAQPSTAHASCPAASCSAGTQMSGILCSVREIGIKSQLKAFQMFEGHSNTDDELPELD